MTVSVNTFICPFRIGEFGDMHWFCFASSHRDKMREAQECAQVSVVLPSVFENLVSTRFPGAHNELSYP